MDISIDTIMSWLVGGNSISIQNSWSHIIVGPLSFVGIDIRVGIKKRAGITLPLNRSIVV